MNKNGIINGIMTEDVDAFLFGALSVLRRQPENRDLSEIIEYNFSRIGKQSEIGLSYGDILLIALLCGGDYSVRYQPSLKIVLNVYQCRMAFEAVDSQPPSQSHILDLVINYLMRQSQ